jgi:undecaprenyl-diphosphatase
MTEFEALILGLIQGLTEFLPVSSSGHLELGNFFLGVTTSNNLLFAIIVHGATALSTVVIFQKDIGEIIKGFLKFEWNESTIYTSKILLSMVPVGVIGVLFEKEIEAFFSGNVVFVAFMLIITGILLSITNFIKPREGEVTYGRALLIGVAQAIAILPGISRSGATISTALISGVEKTKAARFSFLMVLIPILGAMLLKVKDLMENPELAGGIGFGSLSIGFLAAFISGLLACKWMIQIVKRGKLIYFAIYCFLVATAVLIAYW